MFKPSYTITDKLLANIKRINTLIFELNNQRFPQVVLMQFEREARAVSTFASTSIEGNPLPLTEVKKLLKSQPQQLRDTQREVVNYNQALSRLSSTPKFSLDLILDIHRQVTDNLLPHHQAGQWRKEPVVIYKPGTRKVVFLPPDWQQVPLLMDELAAFVTFYQDRIDPLILAGIFHKQFVIIHPFVDGNGRTARLATKVLLAQMGLDTFNLFSFENYYNINVTKYMQIVGEFGDYHELLEHNSIDFTSWLEYFTDGIIDELLRVQKTLPEAATTPQQAFKSHHKLILEYLKTHKFITDKNYAALTDRAKATRSIDFNFLIEQGVIERRGRGKNTYYTLAQKNIS